MSRNVVLNGGPMDGAVVPETAPCLRPDWYRTWPRIRRRGLVARLLRRPEPPTFPSADDREPGRYVVRDGTVAAADATWERIP